MNIVARVNKTRKAFKTTKELIVPFSVNRILTPLKIKKE